MAPVMEELKFKFQQSKISIAPRTCGHQTEQCNWSNDKPSRAQSREMVPSEPHWASLFAAHSGSSVDLPVDTSPGLVEVSMMVYSGARCSEKSWAGLAGVWQLE